MRPGLARDGISSHSSQERVHGSYANRLINTLRVEHWTKYYKFVMCHRSMCCFHLDQGTNVQTKDRSTRSLRIGYFLWDDSIAYLNFGGARIARCSVSVRLGRVGVLRCEGRHLRGWTATPSSLRCERKVDRIDDGRSQKTKRGAGDAGGVARGAGRQGRTQAYHL